MSLEKLYQSISERWRPEDVVAEIVSMNRLTDEEIKIMDPLLQYKGYSFMWTQFTKADDLARQIKTASELFPNIPAPTNTASPEETEQYIKQLRKAIGASFNQDFKISRISRAARNITDIPYKSHRAYNKRFRLIERMADKLKRYRHNLLMRTLAQVAKSRLVFRISREDFFADPDTAMYIAYIVARLNTRSQFTWGRQERAFDQISEMLLNRLDPKRTQWYAIALVDPDPKIVNHLTASQQGQLINDWYEVMKAAAKILQELTETHDFNLHTMIVKRGDDSSSWNEAAGAYNKCRQGWISTMIAAGLDTAFNVYLPGKALRLMAADVAYMHKHYGSGDLHPDTKVWGDLPKPWEVIFGESKCSKSTIIKSCTKYDFDPKGWIESMPRTPAKTKPTPELVYGVTVASPDLAQKLRKLGYFSGPSKGLKGFPVVSIVRDYEGNTLNVSEATEETDL